MSPQRFPLHSSYVDSCTSFQKFMALSIEDEEMDRLARETRRASAYPPSARVRRARARLREFPVLELSVVVMGCLGDDVARTHVLRVA